MDSTSRCSPAISTGWDSCCGGDLGFSLQYQIPVSQLLNQYIWNSFLLASVALVFTGALAWRSAWCRPCDPARWFDHLVSVGGVCRHVIPNLFPLPVAD